MICVASGCSGGCRSDETSAAARGVIDAPRWDLRESTRRAAKRIRCATADSEARHRARLFLVGEGSIALAQRLLQAAFAARLHPVLHRVRLMGDAVEIGRRLLKRANSLDIEPSIDRRLMQRQQLDRHQSDA